MDKEEWFMVFSMFSTAAVVSFAQLVFKYTTTQQETAFIVFGAIGLFGLHKFKKSPDFNPEA